MANMISIRTHLLMLLLFTVMALILTYPVAMSLANGDALPGLKDFDEFEYTWVLWWYKVSLVDRQSMPSKLPFYYPMETQQPLLDVTPLAWFVSVPLVMSLGPVRAYVAYWLLSFVLCAYSAYLLAFWLTKNRWAASVGGIIFAFYPGKMVSTIDPLSRQPQTDEERQTPQQNPTPSPIGTLYSEVRPVYHFNLLNPIRGIPATGFSIGPNRHQSVRSPHTSAPVVA